MCQAQPVTQLQIPIGMRYTSDYFFFLLKRKNNKIIFATMFNQCSTAGPKILIEIVVLSLHYFCIFIAASTSPETPLLLLLL